MPLAEEKPDFMRDAREDRRKYLRREEYQPSWRGTLQMLGMFAFVLMMLGLLWVFWAVQVGIIR